MSSLVCIVFVIGVVRPALSEIRMINVQLDTKGVPYNQSDPCGPLKKLNPSYWQENRFQQCKLVQESSGVLLYHVGIDNAQLQPELQNLKSNYYTWVINQQLNLGTAGCPTLTTFVDMKAFKNFKTATFMLPKDEEFCDRVKTLVFLDKYPVRSCEFISQSMEPVHKETIGTYEVSFVKPVPSVEAVKLTEQLNNGDARCRYNMAFY
ncbi:hypothetical protein CRM22_011352 [Opisthorchis felineus]|uniref:Uncharacterized protein n=1 Tax=Opisthorchis felineus TaxID=147828 RepID=A0A4S2JLS9_OPIFE|nr:hypothetical protein CRM22_011352 [Opisthorchis felineus]